MTTVTAFTAARSQAIEDNSIVDGNVVGGHLILTTHDGTDIDAGSVAGPIGPPGTGWIICTSTTRPTGLSSGDQGLVIWETDTHIWRVWTGTRWRMQEYFICDSTTRPASLVTADKGTRIYEVDTSRQYIWSGSAWVSAKAGMTTELAEIIRTADSSTITTEHEFTGYDRTISVRADCQYKAKFGYRCIPSDTSGIVVMFSVWTTAVTTGHKRNHAELFLPDTTWAEATLPLILPVGSNVLNFSAKCSTPGKSFIVSGDADWPGYYQILETE